jgi:hypothetical protein
MAGQRFPAGARDFSLFLTNQTDSGTHQAFYPMGTGIKATGYDMPLTSIGTDLVASEMNNNNNKCNYSRSYFTTDGQSVSMSWCRAHFGTCDCLTVAALFLWGALSDERTGLLNGRSRSYFTSDVLVSKSVYLGIEHPCGTCDQITSCLKFAALFLWGALSDERTGR